MVFFGFLLSVIAGFCICKIPVIQMNARWIAGTSPAVTILIVSIFILLSPSTARADCANPTRTEGTVIYNADYKVAQFCNGTDWIGMAGGKSSTASDTMVDGWPDAIVCPVAGTIDTVLWFREVNTSTTADYMDFNNPSTRYLRFNASDGSYNTSLAVNAPCTTSSISELYTAGRAFNFVGGQGAGMSDTLSGLSCTDGQIAEWDNGGSAWVCATPASGADNLGDHTATTNIQLGTNYLSGDGGNEGVYVDASGHVGIGTSSPGQLLEISGASEPMLRIRNTTMAGSPTLDIGMNNGNNAALFEATSGKDFKFYNGQYAMTMLGANGHVGIGTTSPSHTLQVSGGWSVFGGTHNTDGALTIEANHPSVVDGNGNDARITVANDLDFFIGNAPRIRIKNNGNVGIGTTAPGEKLEVIVGGANDKFLVKTSTNVGIELRSGTTGGTPYIDLSNDNSIDYDARFILTGDDSLQLDGANLGIGTGTPAVRLDLNTNGWIRGQGMYIEDHDGSLGKIARLYNFNEHFGVSREAAGIGGYEATLFDVDLNTGRFGIGTTAATDKLEVNGAVRAQGTRTKSGGSGAHGGNLHNINWSGSSAQLWIDSTNVGNISLTSDYRAKKNILTMEDGALERIMALRPVTYNWRDVGLFKDDGQLHEGFLAHELQSVIPSAATYQKDALNEKGKAQYQSVVPLEVLPVLTKAIQELKTINEELEERIKTLEQQLKE